MADKTLCEFSAPRIENIHIGPTIETENIEFELKPSLINMVQTFQFSGKVHEDASASCRQKLVGSLPWGIPTVVVYRQTGVQATNLMVTQDTDKVFIQVRPPCGCNTYVLRLIVLDCVELR